MSNVNTVKPKKVVIELDKRRTISYDLNAYAELETIYGSVEAALESLNKNSIVAIRTVLWAGLIHEEMNDDGTYNLNQKQVGAMLDAQMLPYVMGFVNEAMSDSTPIMDEEESTGN